MIQLLLFGTVDLTRDAGVKLDAQLRQSKRVALLAYLAAARPRGFHRRDKLVSLFWPELPTDRARAALRTSIARLRDDLGADLIVNRGADELAVDSALLRCDVRDFDDAMAASRLGDAVTLYRGPFLDAVHVEGAGGEFEDWIATERSRLRDALIRASISLSESAEAAGDLAGAIGAARRAVGASPNDESLARLLIALLARSGNRGSAMEVFDQLALRLHADLGVEPAAETVALVAPMRVQATPPVSATRRNGTVRAPSRSRAVADQPAPVGAQKHHRSLGWAVVVALLIVGLAKLVDLGNAAANVAVPHADVTWHEVRAVTPPPPWAFGARAVLDSTGDALIMVGGAFDPWRKALVPLGASFWRLRGLSPGDAATWTQIATADGPRPAPRWLFGMSSDARYDRALIHGGALGFTSPCANDTWVLGNLSGMGGPPAWREVNTRGTLPPKHAGFDQVYDASRRRLIVFAGHDCIYPTNHQTWVLAFDDSTLTSGAWSLLAADSSAGQPTNRDAYVAGYDTATSRLFVYGGRSATVPTGELWVLDNASGIGGAAAWHPVLCGGEHPVRMSPAGAIDFSADTWTLIGGKDEKGEHTRTVWRISGLLRDVRNCRWEQLAFDEPGPVGRLHASAMMLTGPRGIAMFGGEFSNTPLADAWVLRPAVRR